MGEQDRDLLTLRRTHERLACEREAADAAAESDRAYARRLEAKLSISTSSLELADKNHTLKGKLREEKSESGGLRARATSAESSVQHLQEEVRTNRAPPDAHPSRRPVRCSPAADPLGSRSQVRALKHALQLRAEELSAAGGGEVTNRTRESPIIRRRSRPVPVPVPVPANYSM
eukprot:1189975-Prorocentrum_minimum.AAC.4